MRAIPVRASDGASDRGQRCEWLAVIEEAGVGYRDGVAHAVPFTHKHAARFRPIRRRGREVAVRYEMWRQIIQLAPKRLRKTAVSARLQMVRQCAHEQVARAMARKREFQVLQPQLARLRVCN